MTCPFFRLFFALFAAMGVANAADTPYLELGPMVGHVGPNEARIWAKASGPAVLSIKVGRESDLSDAVTHPGPTLNEEGGLMGVAGVTGLLSSTRYVYALFLDDKPVMARPYPTFESAPKEGAALHTRIAFSSCARINERESPAATWADLGALGRADILLLLGDNHYGDTTSLKKQRTFYHKQRTCPGFKELTCRTPTYAIWDDHDFGPNNSDRTANGKEHSLTAFRQHHANPGYGEPDNPGIYHTFRRGDIDFFMLDVRYHRHPNKSPNTKKKSILGKRQLTWLKQGLKTSTARIKIVCGGSEFQKNGSSDSWANFPHEQAEFLDFLETENIEGVLLLSGDRHFTAGYQIRERVIEITAGPMGSRNASSLNVPERFFYFDHGKMFAVLDIDTRSTPPKVTVEIHGSGNGLLHKQKLGWDEINGRKKIPTLFDKGRN